MVASCSTRGSGIVSSAAGVLWMRVVRGMRGVDGVCEICMCLARRVVGVELVKWMRGLGLGFTNPVGTGECWTCVLVAVVWVGNRYGAWTMVWRGGGVMCVRCESGFSV